MWARLSFCDFHYQVQCLMPNHAYNLLNIHIVIQNGHTPSTKKELNRRNSSMSYSYIGTGHPGLNQYLARINVLAQGHNAMTPVRLEPMAPWS